MTTQHPAWAAVGRPVRYLTRTDGFAQETEMTAVVVEHTPTQVVVHNGDRFVARPGGYYKIGQASSPQTSRIEEYVVVEPDPDDRPLAEVLRDVLSRDNDVREWPADEQALHRGWTQDFFSRGAAMTELRARKVMLAVERENALAEVPAGDQSPAKFPVEMIAGEIYDPLAHRPGGPAQHRKDTPR